EALSGVGRSTATTRVQSRGVCVRPGRNLPRHPGHPTSQPGLTACRRLLVEHEPLPTVPANRGGAVGLVAGAGTSFAPSGTSTSKKHVFPATNERIHGSASVSASGATSVLSCDFDKPRS